MSNWIKVKETKTWSDGTSPLQWKSAGSRLVNTDQIFHVDDYAEGVLCLYFDQDTLFIVAELDEFLELLNQGRPGSDIEVPPGTPIPLGCSKGQSVCPCEVKGTFDPKLRSNKESNNLNTTTNSGTKKPTKAIPVEYQRLAESFANHFSSSTGRAFSKGDLARWGREFMVLAQRLNVGVSRITDVMDWIYNDEFWVANVQGVQNLYKLRNGVRKWDNIVAKMNQGGAQSFIDEEVRRGERNKV